MIGATVFGVIKLSDLIRGKQPRMPYWHENDYEDSNVISGTITPPFRNEPARISLLILGQDFAVQRKTLAEEAQEDAPDA
jgi:hypothetical protein